MQALFVVDVFDELADVRFSLCKGAVLLEIRPEGTRSRLRVLKKLSALALLYGLPLADILTSAPALSNRST